MWFSEGNRNGSGMINDPAGMLAAKRPLNGQRSVRFRDSTPKRIGPYSDALVLKLNSPVRSHCQPFSFMQFLIIFISSR